MKKLIEYIFDRLKQRDERRIQLIESEKKLLQELKSKEIKSLQEKYNNIIDETLSIQANCEMQISEMKKSMYRCYHYNRDIAKSRNDLLSKAQQAGEQIKSLNDDIWNEIGKVEKRIEKEIRTNKKQLSKLVMGKFPVIQMEKAQ